MIANKVKRAKHFITIFCILHVFCQFFLYFYTQIEILLNYI